MVVAAQHFAYVAAEGCLAFAATTVARVVQAAAVAAGSSFVHIAW